MSCETRPTEISISLITLFRVVKATFGKGHSIVVEISSKANHVEKLSPLL